MVVQWLRLHDSSIAGGTDLIPGQGTKIPHSTQQGQKKKKKKKIEGGKKSKKLVCYYILNIIQLVLPH